MKNHFKAIYERLRTELEKVNTIDIWNNQAENVAEGRAIDIDKSIFIEIDAAEMKSSGNAVQQGVARIRIHVTQVAYTDTVNGGKDDAGYNPFTVLDYVDDVHRALQNFSGRDENDFQLFSSLDRMSITMDTDHEALHHTIMEYACTLIDRVSERDRDYVDVTPWVGTVIYESPIVKS